jgi:hypothetical protein
VFLARVHPLIENRRLAASVAMAQELNAIERRKWGGERQCDQPDEPNGEQP